MTVLSHIWSIKTSGKHSATMSNIFGILRLLSTPLHPHGKPNLLVKQTASHIPGRLAQVWQGQGQPWLVYETDIELLYKPSQKPHLLQSPHGVSLALTLVSQLFRGEPDILNRDSASLRTVRALSMAPFKSQQSGFYCIYTICDQRSEHKLAQLLVYNAQTCEL